MNVCECDCKPQVQQMLALNTDVCMCVRLNSQLFNTRVDVCVYDFFLIIIENCICWCLSKQLRKRYLCHKWAQWTNHKQPYRVRTDINSNNRYQRDEIWSATSVCVAISIHHFVVLSEHPRASVITDIRMKEVKSRAESVMEQQFTRLDKGSRISVTGSGGSKERSAIYVKKKRFWET